MLSKIFAVAALMVAFVSPSFAAAASQCMCYCGTDQGGAVQRGNMDRTECSSTCVESDEVYVGCYDAESKYPRYSKMCWRQEDCEEKPVDYASGETYEWDGSVPYCEDRPYDMGYCYAPPRTVDLIVNIGSLSQAQGIGGYVNAAYQYLIPVMILVGVVLMMASGLQYILARGNASAIKAAKSRITSVVIGVVLMLSAYTLVRLLDPRLVNFEQIRTPVVKPALLLREDDTCEYLGSVGFYIDGKTGEAVTRNCGETGTITQIAESGMAGVWEKGDTCYYSTCSRGYKCVVDGDVGQCLSCTDIYSDIANTGNVNDNGVTPSASLCSSMSIPYDASDDSSTKYICEYISAGGQTMCSQVSSTYTAITSSASPSGNGLNCQALRSNGGSCRSYDEIYLNMYAHDAFANFLPESWREAVTYDISFTLQFAAVDNEQASAIFERICTDDPCGLAPEPGGCNYRASDWYYDCYSKKDDLVIDSEGEVTGGTCYNLAGEKVGCTDSFMF